MSSFMLVLPKEKLFNPFFTTKPAGEVGYGVVLIGTVVST
jgi:hypothetical protein